MNDPPIHSLDEVRDFLNCHDLSDEQVEVLRDQCYALADLLVETYLERLQRDATINMQ